MLALMIEIIYVSTDDRDHICWADNDRLQLFANYHEGYGLIMIDHKYLRKPTYLNFQIIENRYSLTMIDQVPTNQRFE